MTNTHRFILEPYHTPASRYRCPQCNHNRVFSRYIDTQTNEHLAPHVGRCSRESKCAYHFKPGEYLRLRNAKGGTRNEKSGMRNEHYNTSAIGIPTSALKNSLKNYHQNNFVSWLITLFGEEITGGLVSRYLIGTSNHWPGATIFWQVDDGGNIRTGKIMLYHATTGKRVKEPFNHITWAHSVLRKSESPKDAAVQLPDFRSSGLADSKQCLYGQHLLKDEPLKPVAVVESEKSAIIASVYWPGFIWLAVGSLSSLNAQKCRVLKGRNVTLLPDLNCLDKWRLKAKGLAMGFKIWPLLEDSATPAERQEGLDVADYLLKFDYRDFVAESRKKGESLKESAENEKAEAESAEADPFALDNPQAVLNLFADSYNIDVKELTWWVNNPLAMAVSENAKPLSMAREARQFIDGRPVKLWDTAIDDLQAFFDNTMLPTGPIRINACSTVTDPSRFVAQHFEYVRANNGNPFFLPYLQRLNQLQCVLKGSFNNTNNIA